MSTTPPTPPPTHTRLAILASDQAFADALGHALPRLHGIEIVGSTTSISEFLDLCVEAKPDVALVDYWLRSGDALDCAARLQERNVTSRRIAITTHVTPVIHRCALDAGFEKVLSKNVSLDEIVDAVRVPGPSVDAFAVQGIKPIKFSQRQRQILGLMARGMDTPTIAKLLFISIHTARGHVKKILALLQVRNQLAAVTRATLEGYLPPTWSVPRCD